MEIKPVRDDDKNYVMHIDTHIDETGYKNLVYTKSGYVLWDNGQRIGIMTYCLLWDTLPFINFLFVEEAYRSRGFARAAMQAWEKEMKAQGYQMTLISTRADESAQHLYRKLDISTAEACCLMARPFPGLWSCSCEKFCNRRDFFSPIINCSDDNPKEGRSQRFALLFQYFLSFAHFSASSLVFRFVSRPRILPPPFVSPLSFPFRPSISRSLRNAFLRLSFPLQAAAYPRTPPLAPPRSHAASNG
ncbi:MAG: GNAT family N-acetyltransferase [Christensenellaceae bacterium]